MNVAKQMKVMMAKEAIKGGLGILPWISDDKLISFIDDKLPHVNPQGRAFLEKLMLLSKKATSQACHRCTKKLAANLFGNQMFLGSTKRKEFTEKFGFSPPSTVVISPTMRCNLGCYGCYAGNYTKKDDLTIAILNNIVTQAKAMGIYFIVISGGEPFFKEDILDFFAIQSDVYFQVYTNGTLLDRAKVKKLAKLGNVVPCISVEGYEKETDARRGPGTFSKIMAAMDSLREEKVLFGFSATATRENSDLVSSEEFVDFYLAKGCFLGWYFNYIPIGRKPDMSLMPTPEQRNLRRQRINNLRETRPILLADFWNDGPLVGGCIAGARHYLHINNFGDVEPCVFVHFAIDNIKNKSLAEILGSPMFQAIRKRQPYSKNLLRPCMIIDNPQVLREIVAESGAHPTHRGAETLITDLAPELDKYAAAYAAVVDPIWEGQYCSARVLAGKQG